MNQLDLFSGEGERGHQNKSKDKRPPQLNVSKVYSTNHKWKQCKIIGKNISIRSYSAACNFQKRLYLYGGYQILNGSLHDFYSIALDQSQPSYNWSQIVPKGKVTPGCRSKHALLGGKQKIFLVGGLLGNNQSSNDIFAFDPLSRQWSQLNPVGAKLPPIESFGSVIINKGDDQKIIIAFGFNQITASVSNGIYEYDTQKNKLTVLFEGSEVLSENIPAPRVGCAISTDNQNIFIFGGKSEGMRFSDIWAFSLTDFKFKKLKDGGEVPAIRNGHTMNYYDGKLYVFGGIHDVTWELDDLHIYNIKSQKWTTLEQDSPRKIQKKSVKQIQSLTVTDKVIQKNSSRRKNWYDTVSAGLAKQGMSPTSVARHNFTNTYNQDSMNRGESPGKMLDEQRKKVFYQKKAEMLKNFQISKEDSQKLIILETSSQAMKNSLDVIGNPDPKNKIPQDKLTDFGKESISKFLQPLQNNSNVVIGKKPCARDGHCSVIIGEELVIFGGDRHQMSFNDIYKLNLKMAQIQNPAL